MDPLWTCERIQHWVALLAIVGILSRMMGIRRKEAILEPFLSGRDRPRQGTEIAISTGFFLWNILQLICSFLHVSVQFSQEITPERGASTGMPVNIVALSLVGG